MHLANWGSESYIDYLLDIYADERLQKRIYDKHVDCNFLTANYTFTAETYVLCHCNAFLYLNL